MTGHHLAVGTAVWQADVKLQDTAAARQGLLQSAPG
jgi:hypothetical protein